MDDITDDITQPTVDVQNVEVPTGIIFSFFQCYNNLSVVLGMLGLMFCILVGFIYRRYQRLRHGNRRKF